MGHTVRRCPAAETEQPEADLMGGTDDFGGENDVGAGGEGGDDAGGWSGGGGGGW